MKTVCENESTNEIKKDNFCRLLKMLGIVEQLMMNKLMKVGHAK